MTVTNFEFLMEFEIFKLSNGLRVIHLEDPNARTIHCGFIINAGSRDECEDEHGLAHLIEHCLFKGTGRRKAYHILTRLDSVGGEINAYTTKEETCVYASAMKEHFNRASELLFDIVFSPRFPSKEIIKEVSVINDEINSYKDDPGEMVMDEFEERLFPGHPLGRSILGTEKNLGRMDRDALLAFVDRLYSTDQIVFACVGNVSRKRVMQFVERVLEQVPAKKRLNAIRSTPVAGQFEQVKRTDVHQVHAIVGSATVGLNDERRRSMILLNNILGGPALNSRLNLNIRERKGYCYSIESNFNPYVDVGLFEIYFGTDMRHFSRTLKLIRQEMNTLVEQHLTPRSLALAKKQLIGQIALAQENRASLMLSLGKSLLHFDRVDTFAEMEEDLMSITEADLQELASEVFAPERLSTLAYTPAR